MERKTPKKPLTPFFLFKEKEKQKGHILSGTAAGEYWNNMTEEEREPYIDEYNKARENYESYLISEGITPRKSSMKKSGAFLEYKGTRIR